MFSADFENLKDQCTLCKKCPLCEDRLNIVFGQGNENADILFVGDAPSGKDDLKGTAFSGKEGEILNKFFFLSDIDREKDIFITNLIKCQPSEDTKPDDTQLDSCIEHLRNQVRLIKPKIIVCLGETAAKKMIDPSFSIRKSHGQFIKKGKLFFIATYHPREIIDDTEKRTDFLSDFQALREVAQNAGILYKK